MAWLSGYSKRKPLTLTGGASGAQTDFQLSIAVSYEAAMQGDFDDIRFTRADGTTLVDAWAEVIITDTSATVWVEFPSTPANTVEQDYYMYYGNAGASDWDMTGTFPDLCDDFEDNDVTDWSGSTAAIESSVVKAGTYSGKMTGTSGPYKTGASRTSDYYIEFDFRYSATGDPFIAVGKDGVGTTNCVFLRIYDSTNTLAYYDGSYHNIMTGFNDGTWYKFIIAVHFSTNTFDIWVNGTSRGTGLGTRGSISEHNDINPYPNSQTEYFDNIFVRKYASGPPTYAFGSEESATNIPAIIHHLRQQGIL